MRRKVLVSERSFSSLMEAIAAQSAEDSLGGEAEAEAPRLGFVVENGRGEFLKADGTWKKQSLGKAHIFKRSERWMEEFLRVRSIPGEPKAVFRAGMITAPRPYCFECSSVF
ncbi:MAG TPA: hypothetical protein DIT25_01330 [Candidatus Moranbacteria bacterium]|nr:hypothetical protein [Candidatus Moranbacteria bacterium]